MLTVFIKLNNSIPFPEALASWETWMQAQEADAAEMLKGFLAMDHIGDLLINLVVIALMPAITEELLFRGGLQQLLEKWFKGPHLAIIITGFIFSAIHMQFYGLFARWILGIVLGYMFYWSRNLWYPIIAHFLNNGVQVLLVYLGYISATEAESSAAAYDELTWLHILIPSVLFALFTYLYWQSVQSPKIEEHSEPDLIA